MTHLSLPLYLVHVCCWCKARTDKLKSAVQTWNKQIGISLKGLTMGWICSAASSQDGWNLYGCQSHEDTTLIGLIRGPQSSHRHQYHLVQPSWPHATTALLSMPKHAGVVPCWRGQDPAGLASVPLSPAPMADPSLQSLAAAGFFLVLILHLTGEEYNENWQ